MTCKNIKTVFSLRVIVLVTVLCCLGMLTYVYRTAAITPEKPARLSASPAPQRPQQPQQQQQQSTKVQHPKVLTKAKTQDPCTDWQNDPNKDSTRLWWHWACLMDNEFDKPHPYKCKNLKPVGNWHICWDEPYIPRKPCIVYSFGIAFDFTFDDAMAKLGCEVYSFDPSMGVKDHNHSSSVHFRDLGIGSRDTDGFNPNFDDYVKKKQTWKMKTLKSIKKMLGHQNAVIDVLKIDIEVYEWSVVANFLEDDIFSSVRQFLVEWHIFPKRPDRSEFESMYKTLTQVEKIGLKFYYFSKYARRHIFKNWNSQADMCYVNTKFVKPSR